MNCKITENYLREKSRFCQTHSDCSKCELRPYCSTTLNNESINESIKIVQEWSNEHPQKTYLEDFLEKYPKPACGLDDVCFQICKKVIYGGKCCAEADCEKCWQEGMPYDE